MSRLVLSAPRLLLCAALAASTGACGKTSTQADDAVDAPQTGAGASGGAPTSSSASTQAAQQGAQAGNDAGAADGPVASGGSHSLFFVADHVAQGLALGLASVTGQVSIGGCAASVAGNSNTSLGGYAVDANLTFNSSACTGKIKVSGTESVTAAWTGNANATGRTLQVTDTLTRTLASADTVATTTLDPNVGYTYQITATGMPASGTVDLAIVLNESRVRTSAAGKVIFEHAITTAAGAPLQVQNTYDTSHAQPTAKTRTLVSGSVAVHHLLAKFVADHAMNGLTYDLTGTCACPMSGSMVQTVTEDSGSGGYTRTYTFTGCGTASVVTSASTLAGTANGSTTVTMDDCTM